MQDNYKLAKVKHNKSGALVEYYATCSVTQQLKRVQIRVPRRFKTPNQINDWAERQVFQINNSLLSGSVYIAKPKKTKSYNLGLLSAIKNQCEFIGKTSRYDTKRSYSSLYGVFEDFAKIEGYADHKFSKLDKEIVFAFSNYLITRRGVGNRTHNNYIDRLKAVINYIMSEYDSILKVNPCVGFRKLKESNGDFNLPFTDAAKVEILEWFKVHDQQMYFYVQFMYFAWIRRTELMKLKIKHLNLKDRVIYLPSYLTKNGKNATVPIYDNLLEVILKMNLDRFNKECYVFGKGRTPSPTRFVKSDGFTLRHKICQQKTGTLNFGWTLYTWKDSGICAAYSAGMDIRTLQTNVRHYSLEQLEVYLKSMGLRHDKKELGLNW